MKQRLITGILGGAVFLGLVYLGGDLYTLLIFLLAMIGLYEFLRMAGIKAWQFAGIASYLLMISISLPSLFESRWFTFENLLMPVLLVLLTNIVIRKNSFHIEYVAITILGALYIGYGFHYMIDMRAAENGFWMTILVLLGIWSTDSGAYFVGRKWGKKKLWPSISPNKTIEGSIGGLIVSVVIVVGLNMMTSIFPQLRGLEISMWDAFILAMVTGTAGQIGDLVESAIKRHYGVKDSGRIFPGHGGVSDRFDSWMFVFPLLKLLGLG